jgi:hypothetical protein
MNTSDAPCSEAISAAPFERPGKALLSVKVQEAAKAAARDVAAERGITLSELTRRALADAVRRETV